MCSANFSRTQSITKWLGARMRTSPFASSKTRGLIQVLNCCWVRLARKRSWQRSQKQSIVIYWGVKRRGFKHEAYSPSPGLSTGMADRSPGDRDHELDTPPAARV